MNKDRDYPEDKGSGNGYGKDKCLSCGEQFFGNIDRLVCKICKEETDAKWAAMTPEERKMKDEELEKIFDRMKEQGWRMDDENIN